MILVDTSVWVDHLRKGNDLLAELLENGSVLSHPFVIGELACGSIRRRRTILHLLDQLPVTPLATNAEARAFIEERSLMGAGVGFIDVHLLASTALSGEARLWTLDRRLSAVARRLDLSATTLS